MKAQASNPQRAPRSALHSPMKRQFVKLCDGVIRWNSPPPVCAAHTPTIFPFRLLPRSGSQRCAEARECVAVSLAAFEVSASVYSHTFIHIIANTLTSWLSSSLICTHMQSNEGQPWSQLIKEANSQTLNELPLLPPRHAPLSRFPPLPSLKMCKMRRGREHKKDPTGRHNPPLIQLEDNLNASVRRCSRAGGASPHPSWIFFFFFNKAACACRRCRGEKGVLSRNRCEKWYNSFLHR